MMDKPKNLYFVESFSGHKLHIWATSGNQAKRVFCKEFGISPSDWYCGIRVLTARKLKPEEVKAWEEQTPIEQATNLFIVAFVTSSFTMDKQNPAVRKYIAQRADLLGAIRLPNTAFKENAGTEVVADILFLQKRERMVELEPEWVYLGQTEGGFAINSYFIQHPDMVLGQLTMEHTQYGRQGCTCAPYPDTDLAELLEQAISNIHGSFIQYEVANLAGKKEDRSIPADPTVRNFSYAVVDSQIYFREDSRMTPVEVSGTGQGRIKGMITIRDSVRALIEMQTEDWPDADIQQEQVKLNRLYDAFTKKYGLLSSRGNNAVFAADSSYPLLCALEHLDKEGKLKRKADMFYKRTIRPAITITHVDTASEALAVSLAEKARVDLEYMAQLMGKPGQTDKITQPRPCTEQKGNYHCPGQAGANQAGLPRLSLDRPPTLG